MKIDDVNEIFGYKKRKAIIVDIDGTAALGIGVHREAFEYDKCHFDKPNLPVWQVIKLWAQASPRNHVIFMSGRENVPFPGRTKRKDQHYRDKPSFNSIVYYDDCWTLTQAWISFTIEKLASWKHQIDVTWDDCTSLVNWKLFMREHNDHRADHEVKREMFLVEIEDDYDIQFVLDDRKQVVDMWRKEGLPCFQVAPGDF